MSVFNVKDIVIHNGKVGIITRVYEDYKEVEVKLYRGIRILLPFDCVTVVDKKNGVLDNDCDRFLYTKNSIGQRYKVQIRKTSVCITDADWSIMMQDRPYRTYPKVGECMTVTQQKGLTYTITPQDIVFLKMVEEFEGYWFNEEKLADCEEVCNWIDCIENFIDVEIVWKRYVGVLIFSTNVGGADPLSDRRYWGTVPQDKVDSFISQISKEQNIPKKEFIPIETNHTKKEFIPIDHSLEKLAEDEVEYLREEYYQICSEMRQNFWRE